MGEGVHARASATTLLVAQDLATRMDFDTGEVRYCLKDMVGRLGLSRATVSRHVAYLREMGSLAWVERGSRTNVRRASGLDGYARTSTVYGAVIPPAYDRALGHTVVGSGYTARIVVDRRDQVQDPVRAREAVDNSPVDKHRSGQDETPSLMVLKKVDQCQVAGGKDSSTARARPARATSRRKKRTLTILGYRITSERIDRARRLAVHVRPLVNWTQGATHDQLSWVLLDLVAKNWFDTQILMWLRDLGQELGMARWRPRFPHRVIAAALHRLDRAETERQTAQGPDYDDALQQFVPPNRAFGQATQQIRQDPFARNGYVEYPQVEDVPVDAWDLSLLREAVASDPDLVLVAAQLSGREAALRTYGSAGARVLALHEELKTTGMSWPAP
ncbi:hypothetical protein M2163_000028 [Streptomyces sp. SAI-135]|uniref:hypothetical protein n=1 Tax=unclassified Streptomyces TaxID=2593676 RepID=UPI002476AB64|nr:MULTISPECIES: hypothetical protein [unclassified Streptomyces]MDH6523467.1 hypothetical protein [Streptomyces sp. SAI-090]MDH6555088.1 hypothetical protein [Streptomyces sp. SAI-041]MDH6574360.1 hypothetical protein [Streptomyces sp. SAI-117]MDH6580916.1 hypothetical protein [Streptomyces sp. SAI-133]MDH6612920.1 hypothetical protein [Streptomyces sp. SAI-135]